MKAEGDYKGLAPYFIAYLRQAVVAGTSALAGMDPGKKYIVVPGWLPEGKLVAQEFKAPAPTR